MGREEGLELGREEGREEAITEFICAMKELVIPAEKIKIQLMKRFHLSDEAAEEKVWK